MPTQLDETSQSQVPNLFDDYLLTAVQDVAGEGVIGQSDISAMLGFEEQKDLLNCDDASCMANIGGALGVDRIFVVKVARLGNDWVLTAKLLNIKSTVVEARVNRFVNGDVRALLEDVQGLVGDVFAKAIDAASP
jgi:hypothetical protein